MHPERPLFAPGFWLADSPFHIRHGFVNETETALLQPVLGGQHDVRLFVTRRKGPALSVGVLPLDQTYRFHADYLVRETAERCGPGYIHQTEPLPCDVFVFEFPEGLPPGRYDFWVEWHAPCSEWVEADVCRSASRMLSLYNSNVNMAFLGDEYTPIDDNYGRGLGWPADPWDYAQPLP